MAASESFPFLQVYLPMSYIYGLRGTGELTPLVMDLRQELYTSDYGSIDWNAARNQCAKEDLYYPHPWYQVSTDCGTMSINNLGPLHAPSLQ